MSLYGTISLNGANVVQGSTIAAFGPGGESDVRAVNDIGAQSDYFLTIRSDNSEVITFKLCDQSTESVYDGEESIQFVADSTLEKQLTFSPVTPSYHSADYNTPDYAINLSELLRVIQFYNFDKQNGGGGAYHCKG
jgi:hypothetical protein